LRAAGVDDEFVIDQGLRGEKMSSMRTWFNSEAVHALQGVAGGGVLFPSASRPDQPFAHCATASRAKSR